MSRCPPLPAAPQGTLLSSMCLPRHPVSRVCVWCGSERSFFRLFFGFFQSNRRTWFSKSNCTARLLTKVGLLQLSSKKKPKKKNQITRLKNGLELFLQKGHTNGSHRFMSPSLIIGETQIRTTTRSHLPPLGWLLSGKQKIGVGEDVEKREASCAAGGCNVNWRGHRGKWRGGSSRKRTAT